MAEFHVCWCKCSQICPHRKKNQIPELNEEIRKSLKDGAAQPGNKTNITITRQGIQSIYLGVAMLVQTHKHP
jgi:hypothetical protein